MNFIFLFLLNTDHFSIVMLNLLVENITPLVYEKIIIQNTHFTGLEIAFPMYLPSIPLHRFVFCRVYRPGFVQMWTTEKIVANSAASRGHM